MGKEDKKYCIRNLSQKQLDVIEKALEMYVRLGLLQFDNVIDDMYNFGKNDNFEDSYLENRHMIEHHCQSIRKLITSKDDELKNYALESHWSLGIGSDKVSNGVHEAYEIEDSIRKLKGQNKSLKFTNEDEPIVESEDLRKSKLIKLVTKLRANEDEV